MPAPLVIAHLQLGLFMQHAGAPFEERNEERASVYLTNALTGWEKPHDQAHRLPFPELEDEWEAAEKVKQELPILVILGNPPYNGYAGMAMAEERELSTAYRTTTRAPAPQGQGLNDLYVRFFRMAERRIVEGTGRGIVCLISNYSWLDGLSFTGMRERYLDVFDSMWIDCLNGDRYKTGKLTPDGQPDPSIFSTKANREGIQVGTAIALLARKGKHAPASGVRFRHLWGKSKWVKLLETADQAGSDLYEVIDPPLELGLPFLPGESNPQYFSWPLLPELFPVFFPGVKTSRDDVVVDIDPDRLVHRMEQYFDPAVSHEQMRHIAPGAMVSTARFNAKATREYLCRRGFLPDKVVRYCYRPFDVRWLYWEPETKLLDEKRAEYFPHVFEGNVWLSAGQRNRKETFYQPQCTRLLADHHIVESNVAMFPLHLAPPEELTLDNHDAMDMVGENLGQLGEAILGDLEVAASDLFFHSFAVLHARRFREENTGALRQDWPRIPLPDSRQALMASARLGRKLAALLDAERDLPGITSGTTRRELLVIGAPSRVGGGRLQAHSGHLAVTAGWGHAGKRGICMPAKGRLVERDYSPEELDAFRAGIEELGLRFEEALDRLGTTTRDIYLNDIAYWRNVPARVWSYTIGGYQVIQKWLSYRELELLGRPLTTEEVREVMNIARRIAAILLLEPALDANYRAVKAATWTWLGGTYARGN